jgi:hypothetical protein
VDRETSFSGIQTHVLAFELSGLALRLLSAIVKRRRIGVRRGIRVIRYARLKPLIKCPSKLIAEQEGRMMIKYSYTNKPNFPFKVAAFIYTLMLKILI